jgi:hypothetical protein
MPTADPTPDEQRREFLDMLIPAEAEGEILGFANVAEVAAELDRVIAETKPTLRQWFPKALPLAGSRGSAPGLLLPTRAVRRSRWRRGVRAVGRPGRRTGG